MCPKTNMFKTIHSYMHLILALEHIKRLRLAGHAIRHPELPLSKVILWKPVHGHRSRGRPRATFVDNLLIDTGVETTGELETLMLDRMVWRRVIQDPWAVKSKKYF